MITARRWLLVIVAMLLLLGSSVSAMAALVDPVVCDQQNPDLTAGGIRIDPPVSGAYTKFNVHSYVEPVPDDLVITVTFNPDGTLDFVSNYNVEKVVVKGGRATDGGANCYLYYLYEDAVWYPVFEDYGLITPTAQDISHVDFYFGELKKYGARSIDVEKHTNGFDADEPTGPYVRKGDPVIWTYYVTNTGDEQLTNITVSDDMLVVPIPVLDDDGYNIGDLNQNGVLDPRMPVEGGDPIPAETWVYKAVGTAQNGQYANVATATGFFAPLAQTVSDTDPSHYFGVDPCIKVVKEVSVDGGMTWKTGDDIAVAYSPVTVNWRITVTNCGDVLLTDVVVDDVYNPDPVAPFDLAVGESKVIAYDEVFLEGQGADQSGENANVATAEGTYAVTGGTGTVSDSDYAQKIVYAEPKIALKKYVSVDDGLTWYDADSAPGPITEVGKPIKWKVLVTNPGVVEVEITDLYDTYADLSGYIGTKLEPGGFLEIIYDDVAEVGMYNHAYVTVKDTPYGEKTASDDDPAYASAVDPCIKVVKEVSVDGGTTWKTGDDIAHAVSPVTVMWRITVTNCGDVLLTDVVVEDVYNPDPVAPFDLAAGESMIIAYDEVFLEGQGADQSGENANVATAEGTYAVTDRTGTVSDSDYAQKIVYSPAIDIEKYTNGFDADDPTGPYILYGDAVEWAFVVTNTGDAMLTDVLVTDDILGYIGEIPIMAPGASVTILVPGTADVYGQYANLGSVTGYHAPTGTTVTDEDPSHYFGADPSIDIEKLTNKHDADEPTGPYIHVGDPVAWTYIVTNTGNVTLTDVVVTDDVLGYIGTIPSLPVGQSEFLYANGTAEAGQYANIGTATGTPPVGPDVSDTDPSHYFGSDPKIQIVKTTKGHDDIFGDDVYLYEGDEVVWKYEVTATGSNVPLSDVVVTDDQGVAVVFDSGDDNGDGLLDPGETWVYYASGTAVAGWYDNVGTAEGYGPANDMVDASDPSSYFGAAPDTKLEAEIKDGATMFREGDEVKVIISETNTGNVRLTDVWVDIFVDGAYVTTYVRGEDLAVGETWVFTFPTQATDKNGEVCAIGSGRDPAGKQITWPDFPDEKDCVSWTVIHPSVDIEKSTNGYDADDPTGPEILVGANVTWKYTVTNTGDVPLTDVKLTDDQLGYLAAFPYLDVGESQSLYWPVGVAEAGQYANIGTATGTPPVGPAVSDSDPSHYLGLYPEIDIVKTTNGSDSEMLKLGDAILWRYEVTNPGPVPLSNVVITDSDPSVVPVYVSGDIDVDGILDLDETWIYEAAGVVTYDLLLSGGNPYTNTGYAEGDWTDEFGNTGDAYAQDDSGFTAYGLIEIVKLTNGGDNTVMDWTFCIKAFGTDTALATDVTTPTDGHLDFGGLKLDPLAKYTICEQNVPAGWTSVWYFNGALVPVDALYNPDGNALPPENFGNVCIDVGYGTDFPIPDNGLLEFTVDNTYPGGDPRTPGYWKNWSSVTNGGQMQSAFDNGGYAEGFWTLDDLLNNPGYDIGLMRLDGVWDNDAYKYPNDAINLYTGLPWANDGVEAWRILSNYDVVPDKKGNLINRANDVAYNLARNLLAAKLNLSAGAETGPEIQAYVAEAQDLLVKIKFTGTGSYLGPKDRSPYKARASELSSLLDYYNNGEMY